GWHMGTHAAAFGITAFAYSAVANDGHALMVPSASIPSECAPAVHDLNAHDYLEGLLRLAPHWPVNRVLELAPKYWRSTIDELDDRRRAILVPPWERTWPTVAANAPPSRRAA
ncbi:MAG: hypothetical protein GY944_16095, partial [bacterium]|nr:hypothetical protein [bacterium]